jgi:hypothetical protein
VNYEVENRLLERYGWHLAYDAEDAAESPREATPRGEMWQLGSSDNPVKPPLILARQQALAYVKQRRP